MERLTMKDAFAGMGVMLVEEERLLTSKGSVSVEEGWKVREHVVQKLFEYEEAEDNGNLYIFPVRIGQIVYRINEHASNPLIPMCVFSIEYNGLVDELNKIKCRELGLGGELEYRFTDIGKSVYPTHEDAENALAKMKEREVER